MTGRRQTSQAAYEAELWRGSSFDPSEKVCSRLLAF